MWHPIQIFKPSHGDRATALCNSLVQQPGATALWTRATALCNSCSQYVKIEWNPQESQESIGSFIVLTPVLRYDPQDVWPTAGGKLAQNTHCIQEEGFEPYVRRVPCMQRGVHRPTRMRRGACQTPDLRATLWVCYQGLHPGSNLVDRTQPRRRPPDMDGTPSVLRKTSGGVPTPVAQHTHCMDEAR
jgi:hypothetical protein